MPRRGQAGWRTPLLIGLPVIGSGLIASFWFGIRRPLRRDAGFERHLRHWLPVAAEFRARNVTVARLLVRVTHIAGQLRLLSRSREQSLATSALRLVRFEARPVYASGRYGAWGDTGTRWHGPATVIDSDGAAR